MKKKKTILELLADEIEEETPELAKQLREDVSNMPSDIIETSNEEETELHAKRMGVEKEDADEDDD